MRKSLIEPGSFLTADAVPTLEDRIIARDKQKWGRAGKSGEVIAEVTPEPDTVDESVSNKYDESYDKSDSQQTDHTANQQYDKVAVNIPSQQVSQQTGQPSGQSVIRQAILQAVSQTTPKVDVLKTVTLKLAPSLDKKVEDHCHEFGRRKQDVVRDALLLYFETIDSAQMGEGND